MNYLEPQQAFLAWLRESLRNALDALFRDERSTAHLETAIDHADLKRRQRIYEGLI